MPSLGVIFQKSLGYIYKQKCVFTYWMVKYKSIDEHFFDTERKSREDLKRMYYVLGAWITGAKPLEVNGEGLGIEFRSRHRDLVEKVLDHLRGNYTVSHNKESSYSFHARNVPHLHSRSKELGYNADKQLIQFPSEHVPKEYMPHFIRGIVDNLGITYLDGRTVRLNISANQNFLTSMNHELREAADIQRPPPTTDSIIYSRRDIAKIYGFVYSNLGSEEGKELYLPSVKQALESHLAGFTGVNPLKAESIRKTEMLRERIEKSESLLLKGNPIRYVAQQAGYASSAGYAQAFKKATGMTPEEFIKTQTGVKPEELVRRETGVSPKKFMMIKRRQRELARQMLRTPIRINVYGSYPIPPVRIYWGTERFRRLAS